MQNVGTPSEVAAFQRRDDALQERAATAQILAHYIARKYREGTSRTLDLDDPHIAGMILEFEAASDAARDAVADWREIVGITG